MDLTQLSTRLGWLPPGLLRWLERGLKAIPGARAQIEKEYEHLLAGLGDSIKPYRREFQSFARLPEAGRPREEVLGELRALQAREQARWEQGFVSGAVYHGDAAHTDFVSQVYALHAASNPLHADVWPSAAKFEAEIVSMTAGMLGSGAAPAGEIGGTVTSGGTESILLAMKTYRDWARAARGVTRPEIVVPTTAHAAFDKAAQYFGLRLVRVPVGADYRADVPAMRRAVTRQTVALVGSAPAFPHGLIDPIGELADLARARRIGLHVDACLGGFLLPWAEKLGYAVPAFDFRLSGVTSISADTHKFGCAPKGTSVVLYRGKELRRFQYYTLADWPGGLYFSPTLAGSRPGALIAACWATLVTLGEQGYLDSARRILEAADRIKHGVRQVAGVRVIGDPLFVIALASDEVDIYRVLDAMTQRGWSLNGLHRPPAIHLCVTLRHAQPGVAERFVEDLRAAVADVRAQPARAGGMAPVYGLAATLPLRGLVDDLLRRYIDLLYEV